MSKPDYHLWKEIKDLSPLIFLILAFSLIPGCLSVPGMHSSNSGVIQTEVTPSMESQVTPIQTFYTPNIPSPTPTPTPNISNISDWNPYGVIYPVPKQNLGDRETVQEIYNTNNREVLNVTGQGSADLKGYAIGKKLEIIKGPFSLTFSYHPHVNNPILFWAKVTVWDPWLHIIQEDGYNREYSSDGTKTMTIYRNGTYYLTMEGEYVSIDYTLRSGDPTPVPTPIPEVKPNEE
jgi:hypothetical protein